MERVFEFGLVDIVVLCRSRRPGEHDRIRFGVFCAARLIEKAATCKAFAQIHVTHC